MGILERKKREKQQRRADIMEAAKDVFFSKGLMSATMDEIAERAELSKGTLYLYFQSKEELYLSLLDEGDRIFLTMMRKELLPTLSAEELIRKTASVYYKFYQQYPDYFNIMFFLHHGDLENKVSPEFYKACMCQAEETLKMIEGIIQKGIGEGTFRKVDSWKMTLNLWATANGIFFLCKEKGHHDFLKGYGEQELLEHALDIYLEGLKKK
ncbi:MAG: TetR/AcrR family transcriptional regulator [Candidatus Marinimicrobia bacterium]|nr:TetR/AcrR family transcriptional regulator [Candidatus Neomarinimicrobiota bacterium]MCH7762694.1 TetR/AcrR family transcriptional regulator [Candidatus Neomarinimicrobiota bacterium]